MNEIALLLTSFACICYGIWQQTKVEGWQMRVRWRNERIAELEATIAKLEKRNAALAFALYGKQEIEKNEGKSHV